MRSNRTKDPPHTKAQPKARHRPNRPLPNGQRADNRILHRGKIRPPPPKQVTRASSIMRNSPTASLSPHNRRMSTDSRRLLSNKMRRTRNKIPPNSISTVTAHTPLQHNPIPASMRNSRHTTGRPTYASHMRLPLTRLMQSSPIPHSNLNSPVCLPPIRPPRNMHKPRRTAIRQSEATPQKAGFLPILQSKKPKKTGVARKKSASRTKTILNLSPNRMKKSAA